MAISETQLLANFIGPDFFVSSAFVIELRLYQAHCFCRTRIEVRLGWMAGGAAIVYLPPWMVLDQAQQHFDRILLVDQVDRIVAATQIFFSREESPGFSSRTA